MIFADGFGSVQVLVELLLLSRERIKDSCDQLRVLLPYIRGRKTDMASILEMCVEYLKLVNAALPLDFQNQASIYTPLPHTICLVYCILFVNRHLKCLWLI